MRKKQSPEQKQSKYYETKYGITLKEYQAMIQKQDGKCWICQQVPKNGRKLCVDHRHICGYKKLPSEEKKKEVRAGLCFMCNTSLHGLEKRKNARWFLERTVEYFNTFKIKGDE